MAVIENFEPTHIVAGIDASTGKPVNLAVNSAGQLQTSALGVSGLNTGQATATTGGALIVAARAGRISVTISQLGTTVVYLGPSGVSVTTGVPLGNTQYSTYTFQGGAAIYGVVATGTQAVAFAENY